MFLGSVVNNTGLLLHCGNVEGLVLFCGLNKRLRLQFNIHTMTAKPDRTLHKS